MSKIIIGAFLLAVAPYAGAVEVSFDQGGNKATVAEFLSGSSLEIPAPAVPVEDVKALQWQKMALTVTYNKANKTYSGETGDMSFVLSQVPYKPNNFVFQVNLAEGGAVKGTIKDGIIADTTGNTIDLSNTFAYPFEYPAVIEGKKYTLLGNCTWDQGFVDTLLDAPDRGANLSLNRRVKADKTVRITGSYNAEYFSRTEMALILTAYIVIK